MRLSSEMDNSVTVDYATADGTAHAGDDYVSTSGTLTFAPHERLKYVDVTIIDDGSGEPDETFFLNLSNESSGTMVDPQAWSRSPKRFHHHHRHHRRLRLHHHRHHPASTSTTAASTSAAATAGASTASADPLPRTARDRPPARPREEQDPARALQRRPR